MPDIIITRRQHVNVSTRRPSPKETQVASLLQRGMTLDQIATEMRIAKQTVHRHFQGLEARLQCERSQIVNRMVEMGWLEGARPSAPEGSSELAPELVPAPEEMYYIQNTGFCGNCLKFWCVDGHGYTVDLDNAWKVTKEQAQSICRSRPSEDIPLPASLVEAAARRHVSCEVFWQLQREANRA